MQKDIARPTRSEPADPSADQILEIVDVVKTFGSTPVLKGINLGLRSGEFFTLLGPSGCGKTTLLKILGGFDRPDSGEIRLRGQDLTGRPPEQRPFNLVFQSYALFPHMSVADNVGYGLKAKGVDRESIRSKVKQALHMVGLDQAEDWSVARLSGGQEQRVALARALVNEPDVLLLDEPLGALDLKLRKRLQDELRSIQRDLGATFVYVTHDQEEAMSLSDRVGIMNEGQLVQVGTPEEIYSRPATLFAAEFVGEANFLECERIAARGDEALVRLGDAGDLWLSHLDSPGAVSSSGVAVLRPEDLEVSAADDGHFRGEVRRTVYMGTHRFLEVAVGDGSSLRVRTSDEHTLEAGGIGLRVRAGRGVFLAGDGT